MGGKFKPEMVINGTFGELWVDDYYLSEVLACQAKAKLEKQQVNQTGTLAKGYKVTGLDCTGQLKLNKVTTYWVRYIGDCLKLGKVRSCTIITKLSDPDSKGVERIKLTGVTFDEITLADWEAGKLLEETIPFTFTGWEVLDAIAKLK